MASRGTLPLYYKNSRPVGLPAGPGKSWKDNYLLAVVFVGFVILIAGTFWFLPPLDDKDSDYEKTYGRFTGNAAITDAVMPTEPTLVPSQDTGRRGEGGEVGEVLHEGGRMERGENVEVVKQPIRIKDLVEAQKPVQVFDKNLRPPSAMSRETPQTSTGPPETTKPPETTRPPPPPVSDSQSREGGNGAEEGVGDEEAADPGVEEKRRKIIEVSTN